MESENLELKNEKLELKSNLEEFRGKLNKYYQKEAIRILKHMESLNGDYGEYINNADEDDIRNIQCCCKFLWNMTK